jgi:hypothetical protein
MGNLSLDPLGFHEKTLTERENWKQIRIWYIKVRAFELWGVFAKGAIVQGG